MSGQAEVYCQNCKQPRSVDPGPCPACGATAREFRVTIADTIALRSEVRWDHRDGRGKRKGRGKSRDDVSGHTGKWVTVGDATDYVTRTWQQTVQEQEGERRLVHTEDLPLERKPQSNWLMEQLNYISRKRGVVVYRRFVSYDRRAGHFVLRLGESHRALRVSAATARRGLGGSRAARRRVRDLLSRALRDPLVTTT